MISETRRFARARRHASHRGRRLLALGALGALVLAGDVALPAAAFAGTSTSLTVVDSCDQTPAPGHYSCYAERRTDLAAKTRTQLAATDSTPSGYGPAALQSAYNLTSAASSAGSGQRVYVVDAYNDPTAESDLAAYRSQYGLPACTTADGCFQQLNQAGATSPLPGLDPDNGWPGEIALDLQMVSAICPKCAITLIEADDASDNLFTAVKEATTLGAKFVSMSWGGPEDGTEALHDSTYFASTGVVYTAATGDDAYEAGVIYPATSPDVVAVGGTSLQPSSTTRGWSESAWYDATGRSPSGAGSGCSATESKPSWQAIVPNTTCAGRAVSDVSAVADPATGVAVYNTTGDTGWDVYGGTSAAAPIIAATYALAGTPTADETPAATPYATAAADAAGLNDVTSGSTGSCPTAPALCTAGTGWDGPTGLGTPNGIAAFAPTATTTGAGGSVPNTVTLADPGTQRSVAGTSDTLQLHATDSAGAALHYTATGLPAGLSLNAITGLISGTPRTAGTSQVSATATDSTGVAAHASFSWTVRAAPPSCGGNIVANSGFESGTAGWRASRSVVRRSPSTAHHGVRLAQLDGYGRTHHDTLSTTVTIPAGCHATLRLYLWVNSSDTSTTVHDRLLVSVSGIQLAQYTNRNRAGHYALHTFSLNRYAGRSVTLSFSGYENSTLATAFRLDDITVTLTR